MSAVPPEEYDVLRDEEVGEFVIRINGEEVWKSDQHVLEVTLQSQRGELARAAMAPGNFLDNQLDVVVHFTDPQGPRRLDEVELVQRRLEAKRVEATKDRGPRPGSPKFAQDTTAPVEEREGGENEKDPLSEVSRSPKTEESESRAPKPAPKKS